MILPLYPDNDVTFVTEQGAGGRGRARMFLSTNQWLFMQMSWSTVNVVKTNLVKRSRKKRFTLTGSSVRVSPVFEGLDGRLKSRKTPQSSVLQMRAPWRQKSDIFVIFPGVWEKSYKMKYKVSKAAQTGSRSDRVSGSVSAGSVNFSNFLLCSAQLWLWAL